MFFLRSPNVTTSLRSYYLPQAIMARTRCGRNKGTPAVKAGITSNAFGSEWPPKRMVANRQPDTTRNKDSDDPPEAKHHEEPQRVIANRRPDATHNEDRDDPPEVKHHEEPQGFQKQVGNSETPLKLFERVQSPWKVGAHVSTAGIIENAIITAAQIGANAFAFFLKAPLFWVSRPLTEESVQSFKERMVEFGYDAHLILPHGNYLVNLGNPDAAMREKSYQCFVEELKRCELLGLKYFNFHPGSTVNKTTPEQSITYIAESINRAHKETKSVVTVIENMAGQGNVIGSTFAQIRQIIDQVQDKSRVGVCLDTCHMFAAGYDIRTAETWNQSMADFEKEIGMKYLCGMHLNDSRGTLASKKDLHENIGLGNIGLIGFSQIVTDPRVQNIPLILETPSHDQPSFTWKHEIDILNRISLHSFSHDQGLTQPAHSTSTTGVFDDRGSQELLDNMLSEVKVFVAKARDGAEAKPTTRAKRKVNKIGEETAISGTQDGAKAKPTTKAKGKVNKIGEGAAIAGTRYRIKARVIKKAEIKRKVNKMGEEVEEAKKAVSTARKAMRTAEYAMRAASETVGIPR